jgi:uncharacterized protein YukE
MVASCNIIITQDFVVKKKQKVSINTMRNDCCSQSADTLKLSARMAKNNAEFQQLILDISTDFLSGDSQSYLSKTNKDQLQEYQNALQQCQDKMNDADRALRQVKEQIKHNLDTFKSNDAAN